MITKLQGVNFQAHKELVMDLSPGVNVITGSSDVGKSSIFRMLEWVILNRPPGDEFKNWDMGKKDTTWVQVDFDEGFLFKERSKDNNWYTTPEGPLKALRSDLPPEITTISRMSEINIHSQHDRPFLIGEKPADIAKSLNEVVGLSVIDRLFRNLNVKLTGLRANLRYEERMIDEEKKEVRRLLPFRAYKKKFDTILERLSQVEEKKQRAVSLARLLDEMRSTREVIARTSRFLLLEESINRLSEKLIKSNQLIVKGAVLLNLLEKIQISQKEKEKSSRWLRKTIPIGKLGKKVLELSEARSRAIELGRRIKFVKTEEGVFEAATSLKEHWLANIHDLLVQQNICPTCFSPINEEKVNQIVEELR